MNSIKINLNGVEYTIKQSFRSLMMFETLTKKSVNNIGDSVEDIITLFYCILKANNKDTFEFTLDSFIEALDNEPNLFTDFTSFLTSQATDTPVEDKTKKKVK